MSKNIGYYNSTELTVCRAPNDTQFACLWHTRTQIHPLEVCPVDRVVPLNLPVKVCSLSNTLDCLSAWKSGNVFPFSVLLLLIYYTLEPDMYKFTSVTQIPLSVAVTTVAVLCCQPSYTMSIPYIFRHCDLPVLKITISNQCQVKKLKI